jgi:hypothetical protein
VLRSTIITSLHHEVHGFPGIVESLDCSHIPRLGKYPAREKIKCVHRVGSSRRLPSLLLACRINKLPTIHKSLEVRLRARRASVKNAKLSSSTEPFQKIPSSVDLKETGGGTMPREFLLIRDFFSPLPSLGLVKCTRQQKNDS